MWLRDALPEDVDGLRVLTYGFNSGLVESTSIASIQSYAKEFLLGLVGARDDVDRPLVFVAHSLGGLVVKQALVEAASGEALHLNILKSTAGLLFFGVPNRGLSIESFLPMVHGQPNEFFVNSLQPESTYLDVLHQGFCRHFTFKDSEIVSFFETRSSLFIGFLNAGLACRYLQVL
ncbi:hypothetical protein K440DRAFT_560321 [Wilcoxina mikolae CBS 423.85]|nr:hypothetical protein K440DRAFT_560321 [Wilcoxina mikolae CBS 423.85]